MRLGIIGGGTIARLMLEQVKRGLMGEATPVGIMGRSAASKGVALAREFGIGFAADLDAFIALKPDVVVEAASHDAVRQYGARLLDANVSLIVLSGGALCDDALRDQLESVAARRHALLYVPSGGIGGLDALKAACIAGADQVEIEVTKPPAAWKGIDYVERLGVNLDALSVPLTLFDGSAREGVPHFPQNVNIAAVLSLAGIGFDRTRLKVVAVPGLKLNTHFINVSGPAGRISIKFESVPSPDNPKTSMLACYSALAAIRQYGARARYGT